MREYKYDNAIIYIDKPTEAQINNIKKATEVFVKKVLKEQSQNANRGYDN